MYQIEALDVVKDFSGHRALDHVTVRVPKGEIYGLLGPNGAGKTTLIRILNRITAPDSGEVRFGGSAFVPQNLSQIGYLPEERGLYKKMQISEQAIYLAQLRGLSRAEATKRLRAWFEKFGLESWWNKKLEELSKGMAQKVQFITTVIHEPDLLIFDEPFSGFDPVNAELLKQEILSLKERGYTIIFSTHNMQSVEEMCDSFTLINRSQVVLEGQVAAVKNAYKGGQYQIGYRTPVTLSEEFQATFPIIKQSSDALGQTFITFENPTHLSSNSILSQWIPFGDMIYFEEVVPSMHDIFLKTVGSDTIEEKSDPKNKEAL